MKDTKDPYKIGEFVEYKGSLWKIDETCGVNLFGYYEYYIVANGNTSMGTYVDESEVIRRRDPSSPPPLPDDSTDIACRHKNAYLNKISTALQFWVCPDCNSEVNAPNGLSKHQEELLLEEFERMLK